MKNLLAFALALLISFGISAQQVNIEPANLGEIINLGSLVKTSDGSYVNVGSILNPQALIMQIEPTGTSSAWSKVCGQYSEARDVKESSNGDIVACGWAGDGNAFVASFDGQDGSINWSKTFATDSVEVFSSIDIDPFGNIYVVGSKRQTLADSREIYMKLDAMGAVLWSFEANRSSNTESSVAYCYYKQDSLVVVGTSHLATGSISNGSICMTVLNPQNGSFIGSRMYGTNGPEIVLGAEANEEGIFVLCSVGNSTSLLLTKISWSGLSSESVSIYGDGMSFASSTLTLDDDGVYVSGGISGMGFPETSYVIRIGQDLVLNWARMMNTNSRSTSGAGIDSGAVIVEKKSDGQNVLNVVLPSGAFNSCEPLLGAFGSVELLSLGLSSTSVTFGLANTNFTLGETVFLDYDPNITPCASTLAATLVSFTGEGDGKTSLLRWQTASEQDVRQFVILHSSDAELWQEIGEVRAVGQSSTLENYQFVHENPLTGVNYYMLKTVDLDGSVDYSLVVAVRFEEITHTVLYPNPARAGESISVSGEFESVQSFDQSGREVRVERNGNQITLHSGPGVYSVVFQSSDEGQLQTARVVIN